MPLPYSSLQTHARDSLELASLASSSQADVADHGSDHGSGSPVLSSRPSLSSSRKASLERDDPLDFHNPAAQNSSSDRIYRHGRTFSVSSGFDLAANLFPLTSSASIGGGPDGYAPLGTSATGGLQSSRGGGGMGGGSGMGGGAIGGGGGLAQGAGLLERHKTLTYLNGLSLIVGLIIGSGIFSSPSLVNANAGSPGAALIVWVVAGVLAWTGASSYAELGGAIPLNGGAQAYLAKILGEVWGFLFTWVAVLVLKPGSNAIIAIIMGEYLVRAVVGAEAEAVSAWINKSVALLGVLLVTLMNCVSTRLGTRVNDLLMFLKFVALLAVTVIGIVVAATGYAHNGKANTEWKTRPWFEGTKLDASAWAVALYAGLWAFDGWDNTNYVVGEFRNPSRDLPRVIHTAMPLVIVSYVLANVAYFLVLPIDTINSTNTVAVMFGSAVFGRVGALVLALIVSASCFGALNSSSFTSSRLVYVAGREGYLPTVFGRIGLTAGSSPSSGIHHRIGGPTMITSTHHHRRNCCSRFLVRILADDEDTGLFFTPIYALALNCALTCAYTLVGEFSTLLTFYGVAGYTFYFLTVLSLIILRVREPQLERPYRAWITTPIIFCCVSLFLLSRAVFAQPLQTVIVVAFMVAGVPVYFWRFRKQRSHRRGVQKHEIGDSNDDDEDGMHGGLAAFSGADERPPWWKFWQRWRR